MTYIQLPDSGILLYQLASLIRKFMKQPIRRIAESVYLITLCGVIACTPDMVKKQQPLDLSAPGRIELQLEGIDSSVPSAEIGQQVIKNLIEWGYPIGAKDNQPFSHILKATVSKIEHGNTPTGFSFSAGNSDPRAMDFQKADVLPISCQLTAIARPEQSGELNMDLMASAADKQALASGKLADHISTVCFNLLRELNWPESNEPQPANRQENLKPSWMPEIRIETTEVPANPSTKTAPSIPADKAGVAVEESVSEVPANKDARKQIIIHNQGSPVIFQFGHERK
jgi:hypothetical protein